MSVLEIDLADSTPQIVSISDIGIAVGQTHGHNCVDGRTFDRRSRPRLAENVFAVSTLG